MWPGSRQLLVQNYNRKISTFNLFKWEIYLLHIFNYFPIIVVRIINTQ